LEKVSTPLASTTMDFLPFTSYQAIHGFKMASNKFDSHWKPLT